MPGASFATLEARGAADTLGPSGIGKRTLVEQISPGGLAATTHRGRVVSPSPVRGNRRSKTEAAIDVGRSGLAYLMGTRALVPVYQAAVAATDASAVNALRAQIIGRVARVMDAHAQIVQQVPQADTGPRARLVSTEATDPGLPDETDLATLIGAKAALDTAVSDVVPELAAQLSPQMFGAEIVGGRALEPLPRVRDVFAQIAYEAGLVVQLLEEADAIEALVRPVDPARGVSEASSESARGQAVERLERWRSRPVNFFFLERVLRERRVWNELLGARTTGGRTAESLSNSVTAQARETGRTADVGPLWDAAEVHAALSYGPTDLTISDDDAMKVFEALAAAEPRARALLVRQLHRMGRLKGLCENLPWGLVKQLWESIDDREASKLLEPYFADKGGGRSLGRVLRDQDHWYTDAFDTVLDVATLGAKPSIDQAHDARAAGVISDDGYWSSVGKATGRAAVVGTAVAVTGGIAGELAAGTSEGLSLGRIAATATTGVTSGAVGDVAGHFAGDLYDQILNGKEGFDSLASYGKTFSQGAALGGLGSAAVSLLASRYVPSAVRTFAQRAAVAHPSLIPVLEAVRAAGYGAGVRIRMSVRDFLDAFGNGPPSGFRLAYAGLPLRFAAAPPDARLWITVRPLQDLDVPRPLQATRADEGDFLDVTSVEPEQGTLFDGYGKDASYADDVNDWRHADGAEQGRSGDAELDLDNSLGDINVRQVAGRSMDPRMEGEHGMSVLDEARLGVVRDPRHHLLPVEDIDFFQARGFPGREIDAYCVELSTLEHDVVHGGNQALARVHWREHEWNTVIMSRLHAVEDKLRRRYGPTSRLSRQEILDIMEETRRRFDIKNHTIVHYDAP